LSLSRKSAASGCCLPTHLLQQGEAQGKLVALGDVAYPNGADPLAMELLLSTDSPVNLGGLASFGAWNKAGKSPGTNVAQAIADWVAGHSADMAGQKYALARHFLDGVG